MTPILPYIILCDLGGTFVDVDKFSYAKDEVGIFNILANGFTNYLKFNPEKRIFETLEKIGGQQNMVTHEAQVVLPKIYCDWMAGAHHDAIAVHDFILEEVDTLYKQNFFHSFFEYIVIRNAIDAMFSSEKLIKHQYLIEPMVTLLARINLSQHKLVAVTNWDQHSYPLFLASAVGQTICTYINPDDMIVSGYIKCNKPSPEFYRHIFERYGEERSQYLFIDNDLTNIKAAQELGIHSIHYTGDPKLIEQALIERKIIS